FTDLHLSPIALVLAAFAVAGAIRWPQRAIALSFAVLPAVIALAALWRLDHFFHVRYLAPAPPGVLLLPAKGIELVTRKATPAIAVVIALLLVRDAMHAPFDELDWRGIARSIGEHSRPGDQVVATNDWTTISLGFYLREEHVPVRLLNAAGSR